MIINGRRFFELAEHYQQQVSQIVAAEYGAENNQQSVKIQGVVLNPLADRIIRTLNSHSKRSRTGDQYVRAMFDCALVFYIDKFGAQDLSLAIEKIFIWAYRCRIRQQVVQLATMDNYVLDNNLFIHIKEATQPKDVLTLAMPSIKHAENKNNRQADNATDDPLVKLFKEMNYYEE